MRQEHKRVVRAWARWCAGSMVAGLLALSATPARAASSSPPPASVGCHPGWPVVVYRPGVVVAGPPTGSRVPVACATTTGYPTSESTIAVTHTGAIFYSPANTENSMARSTDGGATWSLVQPTRMQYTSLWNTVDPDVVVDRRTGRLFWAHTTHTDEVKPPLATNGTPLGWLVPTAIANAHGFQVYSSPDDGRTWTTADYQQVSTADWEKVFVGPPSAAGSGAPQPTSYPNIVYLCANAPVEVGGPGRACYRSLDGGVTFAFAGYVYPSPSAPAAVCPALASNAGVVAADGTIYEPQTCSNGTYLAVSRNEGSSYTWLAVRGAPTSAAPAAVVQLAIDTAGDLYVLWTADDQLHLVISHDGGHSWGAPMAIGEPGLHELTLPALAAGPAGDVGVVYYASTNPSSKTLSAYVSETQDALDPQPVFYGAAINDPKQPIFRDYGDAVTPRPDFVGATYDSAGNFWAGVVKQLGPPDAESRVPTTGYVASLRLDGAGGR